MPHRLMGVFGLLLLATILFAGWPGFSQAETPVTALDDAPRRDRIRFSSASTLFPYGLAVAETLAHRDGIPQPIVERIGTQSSIRLFCAGVGPLHPDGVMTTRRLSPAEWAECAAHGVTDTYAFKAGNDALIAVVTWLPAGFQLTRQQLWWALAESWPLPGGGIVPNPAKNWRDVDPSLPDLPISIIGPNERSGKFDAIISLLGEPVCAGDARIAAITDPERRRSVCTAVRNDEAYRRNTRTDVTEVARLRGVKELVIALSSAEAAAAEPVAPMFLPIDGVAPSDDAVMTGRYPLSRELIITVKRVQIVRFPTILRYLGEFVNPDALAPQGSLGRLGLVPASAAERAANRDWLTEMASRLKLPVSGRAG